MRHGVKALLGVLVLGLVTTGLAFAESPNFQAMLAKHLQRLEDRLLLSDDQASRLTPMLQNFAQQRRNEMKAMQDKFRAILTPDQVARLDQMKADWKAKRQKMQSERKAKGEPGEASEAHEKRAGFRHHRRGGFKKLTEKLGLTPDQVAQVKALRKQTWTQIKADRKQLFAQTSTVLNPRQEAKLEQIMSRRHHRFHHRRHEDRRGGQQDSDES